MAAGRGDSADEVKNLTLPGHYAVLINGKRYNSAVYVRRLPEWQLRESFCNGDEPKSGLARDLGDRLQSRNVPLGTSGD